MNRDHGRGADTLTIEAALDLRERIRYGTIFRVEKWDAEQIECAGRKLDLPRGPRSGQLLVEPDHRDFEAIGLAPFEVFEAEDCNLILDAGWQLIMNGFAGSAVTKYTTSAGRIGGGITNTAAAYTQTDLAAATGATNRQWEMLSANPTVGATHSAGVSFPATFPTTDGNFAWAEFGIDQGTAAGTGASTATMLNRGVASPGTKTSAQTWNVTVTITWT